ncbi:hypothetical protein RRF57_011750 [Xylaria bambusicola]|uniref:Uncharacterized protein n=1 Tax=Xylaria bambusicola TaxID=326684 RepID=A0AAN7ZE93_9PEZI
MAPTPSTSFGSDRGCDQKRSLHDTPALLSPEQTDCSDTDNNKSPKSTADRVDNDTTERAFEVVWSSFCALPTDSYPTFHFRNSCSFDLLRDRFEDREGLSQYVDDKVRFDWNADTGDLVLRLMPTFVHDNFQDSVKSVLEAELHRVAEQYPELEPTCRKIIPGGHSSVTQRTHRFNKSPDGQFAFKGAKTSPFIFEVAYSEEEKGLLNKIHEYFLEVPGCTVLSFDLNYAVPSARRVEGYTHAASVSLATSMPDPDPDDPGFVAVEALVEAEMFRHAGQAIQGNLEIPFKLFVPLEQREELPESANNASVCIRFADLARFLSDAEEQQRIRDATPEPTRPVRGIRWRKRDGNVITTLVPEPRRPRTRSTSTRSESIRSASTRSRGPSRRPQRLRLASNHQVGE